MENIFFHKILNYISKMSRKTYLGDVFHGIMMIISEFQLLTCIAYFQFNYLFQASLYADPLITFQSSLSLLGTGYAYSDQNHFFSKIAIIWTFLLFVSWIIILSIPLGPLATNLRKITFFILEVNENIAYLIAQICLYQAAEKNQNGIEIFSVILLNILSLGGCMIAQDTLDENQKFASRHSDYRMCNLCFKFFFAVFSFFYEYPSIKWIFPIISAIWILLKMRVIQLSHPYRSYQGEKFAFCISSFFLYWNLTSLVLLSNSDFALNLIYIQMITVPLIYKIAELFHEHWSMLLYHRNENSLSTADEIYGKLIISNYMSEKSSIVIEKEGHVVKSEYIMYLIGNNTDSWEQLVDIHKNEKLIERGIQRLTQQSFISLLELILKKFPRMNELKLYYSYILADDSENLVKAFKVLSSIKQKYLSFKEYTLFIQIKDLLENKMIEAGKAADGDRYISAKDVVNFNNHINELLKKFQDISVEFLMFWKMHSSSDFVLTKIQRQSLLIEKLSEGIEKIWSYLFTNYSAHLGRYLPIYHNYLYLIRNSSKRAEKIRMFATTIDRLEKSPEEQSQFLNNCNAYSPENVILRVDVSSNNPGNIIFASKSIVSELGWNFSDVLGKNATILMTNTIASQHAEIWKNYMKKDFGIDKRILTCCKMKSGELKRFDLDVTLYPHISEQISVLCILRPLKDINPFLIISADGRIEGYDEGVTEIFEIEGKVENMLDDFLENRNVKYKYAVSLNILEKLDLPEERYSANKNLFSLLKNKRELILTMERGEEMLEFTFQLKEMKIRDKMYYCIDIGNITELELVENIGIKDSEIDIASERAGIKIMKRKYKKNLLEDAKRGEMSSEEVVFPTPDSTKNFRNQLRKKSSKLIKVLVFTKKIGKDSDRTRISFKTYNNKREYIRMKTQREAYSKLQSDQDTLATLRNLSYKLEPIIYSTKTKKSAIVLFLLGIFFLVIVDTLLFVFQAFNKSSMDYVRGGLDVMLSSRETQRELTQLSRLSFAYPLVGLGLWDEDRYFNYNISDIRQHRHQELTERAMVMNQKTNMIRNYVHELADVHKREIIDLRVNVIEKDELQLQRSMHPFDFITAVYNAVIRIVHFPSNEVDQNNIDLSFILENSFDDILLEFEKIVEGIEHNIYRMIEENVDLATNFAVIVGVAAVLMIFRIYLDLRYFMKSREFFIEILMQLDDTKLAMHLQDVQKFFNYLSTTNFAKKLELVETNRDYKSSNKRHTNRTFRFDGVDFKLKVIISLAMGGISFFFLPFIILIVVSQNYGTEIEFLMSNENKLSNIWYNMDLMLNGFYLNLTSGPQSTERKIYVGKIVDNAYTQFSSSLSFLQILSSQYTSGQIQAYISSDLCALESEIQMTFNSSVCYSLGNGALTRGMMGIVELVSSSAKTVIGSYRNSLYTTQDKKNALKNKFFIDAEIAVNFMLYKPFTRIQGEIHLDLDSKVKEYANFVDEIILPIVFCFTIMGIGIWAFIWGMLVNEKKNWRKMCRHIPCPVVNTNKVLMTFILNNSEGLF